MNLFLSPMSARSGQSAHEPKRTPGRLLGIVDIVRLVEERELPQGGDR